MVKKEAKLIVYTIYIISNLWETIEKFNNNSGKEILYEDWKYGNK